MEHRTSDGKKGRSMRVWTGWLLAVLLFTAALPGVAAADSFEIELVEIDARLDAQGHMHVTEYDTYVFDGSFNGIVVRLDGSGSDGIADFRAAELTESGEEIPLEAQRQQEPGDVWEYRVFAASEDETKQFKIEYTVLNAVTVHEDTAELYWQFFDDQNDTDLEQVRVQITMPQPGSPGEVQVYGHGPLHGTTGITEDGAARLDVSPLRAGQLLEVRVLYPPEWSADSDRRSGEAALPRIEAEERAYLAEAEAEREQRQADIRLAWQASLLVLLLNAIVIAVFYLLYGKKHPPQVTGASYDNLPDDMPPAMVAYLVQGRCTDRARSATLFDLVRRGYISLKPLELKEEGKGEREEDTVPPSSENSYAYELDYEFELLRRGETPELHAYERMLLDWLFPNGQTSEPVRFSELLARGEEDTESADDIYAFFGGWEAAADKHGRQQDYFERSTAKLWAAAGQALVQIPVILIAVPGWGKLSAVLPLITAGCGMLVTRCTPEASTAQAWWLGFKQHVEEQLAQEAAAGTGLSGMQPDERLAYAGRYERFMIYALALGVSESEIGQLGRSVASSDESLPTLAERHPVLYYSMLHQTLFSTISQGMNDAASAAVSHLGGSSTATGGFSGGGGGGGGGGRGAF